MTTPKPWMLPLIVVALLAPLAAGLALLDRQGLVLGALIAGIALVLIAARPSPRRRIEAAPADDDHHHALVALLGAIDDPALAQQITRHVERAAAPERREADLNPVLAVEDALREFPADEVIVVGPEDTSEEFVDEIRQRLDRPVELLTGTERR